MRGYDETTQEAFAALQQNLRERQIEALDQTVRLGIKFTDTPSLTNDEFAAMLVDVGLAASLDEAMDSSVQAKTRARFNAWAQDQRGGLQIVPRVFNKGDQQTRAYREWDIYPVTAALAMKAGQELVAQGQSAGNTATRIGTMLRRIEGSGNKVEEMVRAVTGVTIGMLDAYSMMMVGQAQVVLGAPARAQVEALKRAHIELASAKARYTVEGAYGNGDVTLRLGEEVLRIGHVMFDELAAVDVATGEAEVMEPDVVSFDVATVTKE